VEGEVVPSIAREGNRKVGLYEIPERSLNESLNATIARIHATVDFPLQPFVLTSRHGLYSHPSRPLDPPAVPSPPFFTPKHLVLPLMPTSRLKRRALSYGVVTRQFRRLTLRVAGEFSRLTSAQCLCLPRPSHHRLEARLDSAQLDSVELDSTRRDATATLARAHTLPPSLQAYSSISAFLLVLFLGDAEHERPSRPSPRLQEHTSYIDGRARRHREFDSTGQLIGMCISCIRLPS